MFWESLHLSSPGASASSQPPGISRGAHQCLWPLRLLPMFCSYKQCCNFVSLSIAQIPRNASAGLRPKDVVLLGRIKFASRGRVAHGRPVMPERAHTCGCCPSPANPASALMGWGRGARSVTELHKPRNQSCSGREAYRGERTTPGKCGQCLCGT